MAAVVIVCILAVIVFRRISQVESPNANTAGVTSDQVKSEIRDTVGEAYGH